MFEWDETKNQANYEKHGICFEDASLIFSGTVVRFLDDRSDYGEKRYVCLGELEGLCVTLVCTERGNNIRLISARPSSRSERRIYDELKKTIKN